MIKEIPQFFLDALLAVEAFVLDAADRFFPEQTCACGTKIVRKGRVGICTGCNTQYTAPEDK